VDGDGIDRWFIRVKNVATELGAGATITGCVDSNYCFQVSSGANNVTAHQVFKPYVEGTQTAGADPPGVTWNDWDNDDWEWTTAGCECAGDDGFDNNTDDGTCGSSTRDRKSTAENTETVDAVGWYAWNISTTLAQGWYDGTINEEGIILINAGNEYKQFYSTENTELQPFWTFTYTTGAPPAAPSHRRRIAITGDK